MSVLCFNKNIHYLLLFLFILYLFFAEYEFFVGSLFELELEFRTSEMNGLLFSVSEPNGYPALSLELFNGKVSTIFIIKIN